MFEPRPNFYIHCSFFSHSRRPPRCDQNQFRQLSDPRCRFQLQVEPVRRKRNTPTRGAYTGILQAGRELLREEGLKTLWRGNAAAMAMWVGYAALQFPMYKSLRRWLEDVDRRHRPLERLLGNSRATDGSTHASTVTPSVKTPVAWTAVVAGGAAGAFATIVTYPLDWVRTRFASQGVPRLYVSYRDLVRKEIARHGSATVLFQGLSPTLLSVVPQVAITFAIYDHATAGARWTLQQTWPFLVSLLPEKLLTKAAAPDTPSNSNDGDAPDAGRPVPQDTGTAVLQLSQAVGGAAAGAAGKLAVYPLDTVKKRLQTAHMLRPQAAETVHAAAGAGTAASVRAAAAATLAAASSSSSVHAPRSVPPQYSSVLDALIKIAREEREVLRAAHIAASEGQPPRASLPRRLFRWFPWPWFKGLSPSLLKSGAGAALTFWSYEAASRTLRGVPWACSDDVQLHHANDA